MPQVEEVHKCNWPGCEEMVLKRAWACVPHWSQLPNIFRHNILRAMSSGDQEQWMLHSGNAIAWINERLTKTTA